MCTLRASYNYSRIYDGERSRTLPLILVEHTWAAFKSKLPRNATGLPHYEKGRWIVMRWKFEGSGASPNAAS